MRRHCNALRVLLMAAPAIIAAGCGYTTRSQFPPGIQTVHVPMWTRGQQVYRREVEMRLTKAIIQNLEHTPYRNAGRAHADTELSGSIDTIEQEVLHGNPDTGLPNEMRVILVVSFRWTDLRSGKDIRVRKNFRVSATYIPAEPLSEDFFQGSEDVINRLAKRIVEQMEERW